MKLCTAVQEGCGYKDTLRALRYFAPLVKYFTVCITYQPAVVQKYWIRICLYEHVLTFDTSSVKYLVGLLEVCER